MSLNIIIGNTKETLSIYKGSIEYITDFIGNTGALTDGKFVYDDELDAYRCDQEIFDWWRKVVNDHQKLNNRIAVLKEQHGNEAVDNVIKAATSSDLEDEAALINQELDEAFGEQE